MKEKQAKVLADRNGLSIKANLGSGTNGTAFSTECGKVIKITTDLAEFCHASNMVGKELEYFANVYETFVFPDGKYGIIMEELEICEETKHQFNLLHALSEQQGVSYCEIDIEEGLKNLEHDNVSDIDLLYALQEDLQSLSSEDHKNKLFSSDIHEDNIGLKTDGNLAAFDMRYDHVIMTNVIRSEDIVRRVKENQKKVKEKFSTLSI